MKPLTCEMCGSNDVIKQNGLFVCQICGTKYSVEEARKMMIEGPVDVSGSTVKIDNSEAIKNYLILAESAFSVKNYTEAESYSNKALELEPSNSHAWFLKGKAAGWQTSVVTPRIEESVLYFSKAISNASGKEKSRYSTLAAEEFKLLSVTLLGNCCIRFAKDPTSSNSKEISNTTLYLQKQAIQMIRLCEVAIPEFGGIIARLIDDSVKNGWKRISSAYYVPDGHANNQQYETFKTACLDCISLLKASIQLDYDNTEITIWRYEFLITITSALNNACSWKCNGNGAMASWTIENQLSKEEKNSNIDNIMEYHSCIKELDPNYTIPKRPSAGGCYVATCVYGSYDCPEVWTLRRYRDDKLALSLPGRVFIHTYYAISPTIVKVFGRKRWFKAFWKRVLDIKVKKLKMKGFEDSPYNDKEW